MPLGSSSEAPVISPGPRTPRRRGLLGQTVGLFRLLDWLGSTIGMDHPCPFKKGCEKQHRSDSKQEPIATVKTSRSNQRCIVTATTVEPNGNGAKAARNGHATVPSVLGGVAVENARRKPSHAHRAGVQRLSSVRPPSSLGFSPLIRWNAATARSRTCST